MVVYPSKCAELNAPRMRKSELFLLFVQKVIDNSCGYVEGAGEGDRRLPPLVTGGLITIITNIVINKIIIIFKVTVLVLKTVRPIIMLASLSSGDGCPREDQLTTITGRLPNKINKSNRVKPSNTRTVKVCCLARVTSRV